MCYQTMIKINLRISYLKFIISVLIKADLYIILAFAEIKGRLQNRGRLKVRNIH